MEKSSGVTSSYVINSFLVIWVLMSWIGSKSLFFTPTETLGVAPSKFNFGVTALCRSSLSNILLQGGINEKGGRWSVLSDLIPEPFSPHLMLPKTESSEIDPNSYGVSKRR
jgi:hypothetical protein